jgi:hypothetical protein
VSDQLEELLATRTTAPYVFWGLKAELEKGAPLESGETVVLAGQVRCSAGSFLRRPCFVRLTQRRLTIVVHYALQPDRLITIPWGAPFEAAPVSGGVRLRYRTTKGDQSIIIWIARLRRANRSPDDDDREQDWAIHTAGSPALTAILNAWQYESTE